MQTLRAINAHAKFLVRCKSDFWIQRSNPFDPEFSKDEVYRAILDVREKLEPGKGASWDRAIRSAVLNAMQYEKESRMKALKWDPYGTHPSYDINPLNSKLSVRG